MRRAAFGALAACVLALVVIVVGGGSTGYRVHAVFADANGIRADYWVRVNGAVAGTISNVDVTPGGQALVTMNLNKSVAPIGSGATAEIRPTDLLGENYVQLNRGDLSAPEPSGTTIPLGRTSTPIALDQVLDMLAPTTRAKLRILINEAGIAMAGRGANFNALLQQLPGSLKGAQAVTEQLASENTQLGRLIDQADLAVHGVDQHRVDVNQLVAQADGALSAVASRRTALAATVRAAPSTLAQITTTLDGLNTAAARLRPAGSLLAQTAPALTATLQGLPGLATSLRSPLQTATDVAPALTRLGTQGAADVSRLTPMVALLSNVLTQAQPLVNTLGRGGGVDGVGIL